MPPSALPTGNADALRNFVAGSEQFGSYLETGLGSRLNEAHASFTNAAAADPEFQLSIFYRSLVQSELRDSDSAIKGFSELLDKGVKFQTEVLIHLAYAHIKRYTDPDYYEAEGLMERARMMAGQQGRKDLQLLIDGLKVFLYAVMGGRLSDRESRPQYLKQALELGQKLLNDTAGQPEVHFEVLNGLGIAQMRKGQASEDASEKLAHWTSADERYRQALALRPHAVRVMQNLGTLKGIEALFARQTRDLDTAHTAFEQAKDWVLQSLQLNPNDEFPHYRLSQLYAMTGDWENARKYYDSGMGHGGAVKPNQWSELLSAIDSHNASTIAWQ